MSDLKESRQNVLFSFGLISDIQYAEWDDRKNFTKTKWRRYRNALLCLRKAVNHWKGMEPSLTFIVQLGDMIDGINTRGNTSERNKSEEAFTAVMKEFEVVRHTPVLHNIGNHELYNFSRKELAKSVFNPLNSDTSASYLNEHNFQANDEPGSEILYFSFCPHPQFCFVFLDTYDISALGWENDSPKYKEAIRILRQFNHNKDLNSPHGLSGNERRFVKFNGGVGTNQLNWLEAVLAQAEINELKVVIFGHVPLYPDSCDSLSLLWNYQAVLDVIWQFKCVVACFHGHAHEGVHVVDSYGIHHRVFEALVEAPLDSNAFATLHVKEDSIVIEGFGIEKGGVLRFSSF